jgi:hypothetical protein
VRWLCRADDSSVPTCAPGRAPGLHACPLCCGWTDLTPVDQTVVDPVTGDCLRACVASLTGLRLAEVPDFAALDLSGEDWWDALLLTLRRRGLRLEAVEDPADEPGLSLVTGPSPRFDGAWHAVVHRGPGLAHDPHPSRAGVRGVTAAYAVRAA